MTFQLEARYLTIDWLGPKEARMIEVSEVPIRIEPGISGVPELEIQIFPDDFSWLGIRSLSNDQGYGPRWIAVDGQEHLFIPIQDAQATTWWVPALEWVAEKRRHHNAFSRSLGEFNISIGAEQLLLRTVTHDCSRVVLEDYLRGFKDELIWLIFGFNGAGTVTGASQSGEELVAALGAFIEALRQASRHLATEIRESTCDVPRRKLRPNAETFRRFVRNPGARHLPSRVAAETANLPDNRYLRHMARQCSRLIRQMHGATQRQALAFQSHAQQDLKRAEEYGQIEDHEVDPDIFDIQLGTLESKLDELRNAHIDEAFDSTKPVQSFPLKLGKRYGDRANEFFYHRMEPQKSLSNNFGQVQNYSVVRFPDSLAVSLFRVMDFSTEYVFQAPRDTVKSSTRVNSKGTTYRFLEFEHVPRVEPRTRALENKRTKRVQLEKNGWRAPLSSGEKHEYRQAATSARKRFQAFDAMAKRAEASSEKLTNAIDTLRHLDTALDERGVGYSAKLPSGMRYSMNPRYAACLKAYRDVQSLMARAGVDASSLDRVEKIGTLHASAVYERWCLVKILGVLISEYDFEPQAEWQARLIEKVTGLPGPLDLELSRPDIGLTASFEYQPQLANGRRPDFRLRFFYASGKPKNSSEEDPFSEDLESSPALIMDAKFRTRWRRGELQDIVDALVDQKQYNINEDRVFVLHPVSKSIANPNSPLEWARHCDYGHTTNRNHRRGSVWLSPSVGLGDEQRHLRRLIDLQLQASFGTPYEKKESDRGYSYRNERFSISAQHANLTWPNPSFCISCGKRHTTEDAKSYKTKAGNRSWIFSCQDCGMTVTRTHCFNCKTDLFKNHTILTYHNTIADQPTHVICPCCGSYFDADWKSQSGFPNR